MSKTGFHIRQFFTFSHSQRNALLVLFSLLLLLIAGYIFMPMFIHPHSHYAGDYAAEIAAFEATRIKKEAPAELTPYPFNPNTLDEQGWLNLGLQPGQVEMILKYRTAGGTFRTSEDLSRLYALSDEEYEQLAPYVSIPPEPKKKPDRIVTATPVPFDPNFATGELLAKAGLHESQVKAIINYREAGGSFKVKKDLKKIYTIDDQDYRRLEKYILLPSADTFSDTKKPPATAPPLIVELNGADTAELQKLPGVGPVFARRIVKYRELLGGFYDPAQLLEVFGMDTTRFARFAGSLTIDTGAIRTMDLNSTGFKDLLRHPYLEYYMVKSIFDYKDANGNYDSVAELRQVDLIYDGLYRKISHYLTTENNQKP